VVQKKFTQQNEDIATEALSYLLESHEVVRNGMMKILRSISPELPSLRFKTQQTDGSIRPDMGGFVNFEPFVFIENKFWAGLTDNQPISYLKQLATNAKPTVLLVIAPEARQEPLWRELKRRLKEADISIAMHEAPPGIRYVVSTKLGPKLALTSWEKLLSILEQEAREDPTVLSDLFQFRALCDSAGLNAFTPLTASEISDHRIPALILQMGSIIQNAVELALTEKAVYIGRALPQASWERIGRYLRLSDGPDKGAGAWFGVHFKLWKTYGIPLWLIFHNTDWGRAYEVAPLLDPYITSKDLFKVELERGQGIALPIRVPTGEEEGTVLRSLVDDFKFLKKLLEILPPKVTPKEEEEGSET